MLLACAMCSEMLLQSRWWLVGSAGWVLLGLVLELVLFEAGMRIARRPVRGRSAAIALAGLVLVLSLFTEGPSAGAALASVVLAVSLARSSWVNRATSPVGVTWVRASFVGAFVVFGVWKAWPAHRELHRALDIAEYVSRFELEDGWVPDELRRREGTRAALEAELLREPVDEGALQVHAQLGFPREGREDACRRRPPNTTARRNPCAEK